MNNTTQLYIVPTPIGNLEDITLRAIRILKEVDCILAEDTRTSSKLLKEYNITTKTQAYHQYNEHQLTPKIIERMQSGERLAIISDGGTPGISDPGYLLVKNCIENNIVFESLPGPTAFVPALINSGFPNHNFVFVGFLPPNKGRLSTIQELSELKKTLIIYESPHKIIKLLTQLLKFFPEDTPISISRELSKIYEESLRGTLIEIQQKITEQPIKGELVMILNNNP